MSGTPRFRSPQDKELAAKVRKLHLEGKTQREIAAELGIAKTKVARELVRQPEAAPQPSGNSLKDLIDRSRKISALNDELYGAYHGGDAERCAEIDAEIRELNPQPERCDCLKPDCEKCWGRG